MLKDVPLSTGVGFWFEGLNFGAKGVWSSGFTVLGLGFRVWCSGFRVPVSGCMVWGRGFTPSTAASTFPIAVDSTCQFKISLSFPSLESSDTNVYEPYIRSRLGTAAHFCEVVAM